MIIGITGGSGSGKTTVISRLVQHLSEQQLAVLHMDSYYKAYTGLAAKERAKINFDHPDSVDFDLLYDLLLKLKSGEKIEEPVYDFATSTRQTETTPVIPAPVIIAEGILIFSDKRLLDLFTLKIFVDAEPDERVIRIIERDTKERGKTLDEVLKRYEVVKEMYLQFIEPAKRHADIIIPQGGNNAVAIELLVDAIRQQLRKETPLTSKDLKF